MRKNQYKFKSGYTELYSCILRVYCENKSGKCYELLVDFNEDEDPYQVYYLEGIIPDDNERFRKELSTYLNENYPECFS